MLHTEYKGEITIIKNGQELRRIEERRKGIEKNGLRGWRLELDDLIL